MALCALLAAAAFGLRRFVDQAFEDRDLARYRRGFVTSEELGQSRLDQLLRSIGLIRPMFWLGADPEVGALSSRPGPAAWLAGAQTTLERQSRQGVAQEASYRGVRVMSIAILEQSWERLQKQPHLRGPSSEQPAWMTLFEGDRQLWSTPVGIRVQGNYTRKFDKQRSYQLLFHPAYGSAALPAHLLGWSPAGDIERLHIANDTRRRNGIHWRLTNQIALDIAHRIGALTPQTAPALLYVNGESRGLFFLTERLSDDYLRRSYGHADFAIVDTKSRDFPNGLESHFLPVAYKVRRATGMNDLEADVDLDNLISWMLSIAFCGTRDEFQGLMLRDLTAAGSRWHWINWDMDISFEPDPYRRGDSRQIDMVRSLLVRGERGDFRQRALKRLWRFDPGFRVRVSSAVDSALARVTPAYLDDLLDHYREILELYEVEDLTFLPLLEQYLDRRPQVVREQFDRQLSIPSPEDPARKRWRRQRLRRQRELAR
ncbi:MAG: CotH kinase family protein [Acidobacteriota bacterium]|nr:CotH kinase family protein [Acidobacteriota bacterium]